MTTQSAKMAEAQELMNSIGRRLLIASYENMNKRNYQMLGWTPLHETMWLRFDRCCHEGRRLNTVPFPMKLRPGKVGDNLVVRRPKMSDEFARKIAAKAILGEGEGE